MSQEHSALGSGECRQGSDQGAQTAGKWNGSSISEELDEDELIFGMETAYPGTPSTPFIGVKMRLEVLSVGFLSHHHLVSPSSRLFGPLSPLAYPGE